MKKFLISLMVLMVVIVGCSSKENSETLKKSEELFELMVSAHENGRMLTAEEQQEINDFYLYKPLKERGDELDFALNQMFLNFGNKNAFEEFKKRAEVALKEKNNE